MKMQDTQLEAYNTLKPHLNRLETEMHNYFKAHSKASFTDLMLAHVLGWKLSCVCGRRNALVKFGLVERAGKIKNPDTHVSNILWRLKNDH